MADEMIKRSEFVEYMEAFEERLVARIDGLERRQGGLEQGQSALERRQGALEQGQSALERRQGALEQRQEGLERGQGRLEEGQGRLERRQGGLEQRQGGLEQRQGGLEQRQGGLERSISEFEHRMSVQFEETRGLIRLSLEGLDALRETTERGFADVRRENHENRTLLEAAVKHVRRRVERVENRAER